MDTITLLQIILHSSFKEELIYKLKHQNTYIINIQTLNKKVIFLTFLFFAFAWDFAHIDSCFSNLSGAKFRPQILQPARPAGTEAVILLLGVVACDAAWGHTKVLLVSQYAHITECLSSMLYIWNEKDNFVQDTVDVTLLCNYRVS